MTQDQKTLFEVSISKVNNSASSIFSKDDVIGLLTTLESCIADSPKETGVNYDCDAIVRAFNDIFDEYDFDEFVSFEPELCGSYGSSYSLEINHSFDDSELRRCIINDLEKYFSPNEPE
jgi:hypothetical protein